MCVLVMFAFLLKHIGKQHYRTNVIENLKLYDGVTRSTSCVLLFLKER